MPTVEESPELQAINIADERLCFIILEAPEYDAMTVPGEPDPGGNSVDDDEHGVTA